MGTRLDFLSDDLGLTTLTFYFFRFAFGLDAMRSFSAHVLGDWNIGYIPPLGPNSCNAVMSKCSTSLANPLSFALNFSSLPHALPKKS